MLHRVRSPHPPFPSSQELLKAASNELASTTSASYLFWFSPICSEKLCWLCRSNYEGPARNQRRHFWLSCKMGISFWHSSPHFSDHTVKNNDSTRNSNIIRKPEYLANLLGTIVVVGADGAGVGLDLIGLPFLVFDLNEIIFLIFRLKAILLCGSSSSSGWTGLGLGFEVKATADYSAALIPHSFDY